MHIMQVFKTVILIGLMALLSACDKPVSGSTLKVLAGSELKDIEPMLDNIRDKTGVQLQFEYIGTLDGAEKIIAQQEKYDVAWFSHAKYLSLLQGNQKLIQAQEKIALSPVIPAVKESLARKWGWIDRHDISWADIASKVKAGEFKYAMTDPTSSNSGFSTVMSVQAAFSNTGDAITAKDVDSGKLKTFFSGQSLTAGSSGFLSDSFLRDQANLDGIFNYESELLKLNRNPALKEKLVLIYPKEGTVTADYPFILLDKTKQDDYQKVVDYLKSPQFQTWIVANTDRRPVHPEVPLGSQFDVALSSGYMMDLPFPQSIDTVNEILMSYLNENRKPSHSFFVLDLSGSMEGERIQSLKRAMGNLAGDDESMTGRFSRFRNREKVTLITFNSEVIDTVDFSIDKEGHALKEIKQYVNNMKEGGRTAIFTAMRAAYEKAMKAKEQDPKRFYSVVLMTDGVKTDGIGFDEFKDYYVSNSDYVSGIRTFPIMFGEASSDDMKVLADLTGGKVFDGRGSLAQAFKQIRGYQ